MLKYTCEIEGKGEMNGKVNIKYEFKPNQFGSGSELELDISYVYEYDVTYVDKEYIKKTYPHSTHREYYVRKYPDHKPYLNDAKNQILDEKIKDLKNRKKK